MNVEQLVMEAQAGDVDAFTELVRRYQAMAFGYAYANLGDFHAAEDATQGAFLAAWRNISNLHHRERFGGWLRAIVRFECTHALRKRHVPQVSIDVAGDIASVSPGPAELLEAQEARARILAAIHALPQPERDVTVLFYIEDHSQRDVAAFLNLPVTTVNNRLRSARKHLKQERLSLMARDALQHHGLPEDFAERIGEIVRADGPIIDARFAADQRPAILNAITTRDDTNGVELTGPVTQHLDDNVVRGILRNAATGKQPGLRPGMRVTDTAAPVNTPLDHDPIAQLIASLRRAERTSDVLETGIKAIDVCCPLPIGGLIGLVGDMQSGKMVLVEELIHRLADAKTPLSMLVFVETAREVAAVQQVEYRMSAAVEVIYLPVTDPSPEALGELTAPLDAVIAITRKQAEEGLYPAIDPRQSRSRLLDPAVVGQQHVDVVRGIHQVLDEAAGAERATGQSKAVRRARLIQRFLTQPFFVAEAFTNRPGSSVSREDAVAGFKALLDGVHDDLAEDTLYMTGTLEEALAEL
jgi:RNA polymerase sigma factor (sigma-70 family)